MESWFKTKHPGESRRRQKSRSPLARRLLNAKDDPPKQRICDWLSDIIDDRLLSFGLTAQDNVHYAELEACWLRVPRRP
jgi:hypothetical protein